MSRPTRGLTLVEVIVSIGIVVTLLGLLVPAVSGVRESSKSIDCATHLRGLGSAAAMYATTHREWYPAATMWLPPSGGNSGWVLAHWDQERLSDGSWRPGTVARFLDAELRSFQCPCCLEPSPEGEVATGYNYNTTFVGTEGFIPAPDGHGGWLSGWSLARLGIRPGQARRTETCAMFGDGAWAGGTNRFMRAPGNTVEGDLSTVYAGGQAFRHLGATSVCWLDGHVSTVDVPHRGVHAGVAGDSLVVDVLGAPRNGFLSDDDRAYDPR
ncbi:MAG: type II secretion system protein [Planctomycetota bacterium]|nr:type II secretion system protein [Planctomycetota bacterium]MDA1105513.1 type II secretion system protein [Planctomycetota bacterium]